MKLRFLIWFLFFLIIPHQGTSQDLPKGDVKMLLKKQHIEISNFSDEWLKKFISDNNLRDLEFWHPVSGSALPNPPNECINLVTSASISHVFNWGSKAARVIYLNPEKTRLIIVNVHYIPDP